MIYAQPGQADSIVTLQPRYGNFIGGEWKAPVKGEYFKNVSPVTGEAFCEIPRSTAEDIELALDAAHAAKDAWARTSVQERSNTLLKIADRLEANLEQIAVAETWDNGKAVRETLAADVPLAIDHFRYFAGCCRPDHSLELPAADGGVENCSGTGGRQLHHTEACRADSVVHSKADGNHSGPAAAGRAEYR
jgi:aldehyde dehydrogenase